MDRFVNFKSTTPSFFYIDWVTSPFTTHWLIDKPEQITYQTTVLWKDYGQMITICCHDETEEVHDDKLAPETIYHANDGPMLKSLLQKCIRRVLTEQALQAAWHFMHIDINAFIRRLCVIMIEDVILHSSFSTIMWLVSALSKGYQIKQKQAMWLLGVVKYLATEREVEPELKITQTLTDRQLIRKLTKDTNKKNQVLCSVMFRISYGGMHGDINMFRQSVQTWLLINQEIKDDMIELIDPVTIKILQRDQILLNCIDFHCYPQILKELTRIFPQYTDEEIKHCLWECNSKSNYRKHQVIKDQDMKIWSIIEKDVKRLQKHHLHL